MSKKKTNKNNNTPGGRKWSEEQLTEAVELGKEIGYDTASKQTGIPYSTIRKHYRKIRDSKDYSEESPELQRFKQEVRKQALNKASDYMYNYVVELAAELYGTASEALAKTKKILNAVDDEPKKAQASWLKALTDTWEKAIQSGQLLTNKPTSREERLDKQEHRFLEDVVGDQELARELQGIISKKVDKN